MKMLTGTSNFSMVINNWPYWPGPYVKVIFCVRAICCGVGSGHFMWICLYKHQWRQKPLKPAKAIAGWGQGWGKYQRQTGNGKALAFLINASLPHRLKSMARNTNALVAALFSLPVCWDSGSRQIKNMFTSPWVLAHSPGLNYRFSNTMDDAQKWLVRCSKDSTHLCFTLCFLSGFREWLTYQFRQPQAVLWCETLQKTE